MPGAPHETPPASLHHPGAPLTEAQAGLWFVGRLDPGSPMLNTGQVLELRGPLDADAFRAAVDGAVAESDALALRFRDTDDGPRQWLDESHRPWLREVDLAADPDPLAEAIRRAHAAMDAPLDPARDRLCDQVLFRLGPGHHLWFQRIDHLCADGYGTELIDRRVSRLYAARTRGADPGPPLAPFSAALEADAEYRASPRRAADAAYWRDALRDAPPVPGPVAAGHGRHRLAVDLPADLAGRLRALGESHGVSWPDAVATVVACYCRRHAGGDEAAIGACFMDRLGSAAARVPATRMNVLPVRLAPDEDAPLAEALREGAARLARARRHGRYRAEQLRRDLRRVGPERRLHGAVVNVLPLNAAPDYPGLDARLTVLGTGPVDDITFEIRGEIRGGIGGDATDAAPMRLVVEANPALHDADAVAAHARRLSHFLGAALRAERLRDVPTATPDEAQWAVFDLNRTEHALPDTTLAALLARGMRLDPAAEALVSAGRRMRHDELDRESAALAAALRGRGVGPGALVAVSLPRSAELVLAILATLRAGAAFLPLDPDWPAARRDRVLAIARPALALSHAPLPGVSTLPPSDWPRGADATAPAPAGPAPDDAAYVLFTSGSTGEPKGVVVGHRAICNRLLWMRDQYGFGPADRVLQKTPASFDVSVWEFLLPVLCGATLVLAPPGAHRDPAAVAALLRAHAVTAAHFVPSMLQAFLHEPAARGLAVARVFCSGEELPAALRDRFHATLRGALHNLYGPTEAAVDVSSWEAGADDRSRPVPIGRPVWNTRLYVLDRWRRPVPPGVEGELFLGGVQLARGYLGRPDLTEAAFGPDPFRPGERVYRTGDLASLRADGAVLFHGRADGQVKIRGVRVEPGEVEAAISEFPGAGRNRVIAREDRPGDRRLVAYVAAPEGFDAAGLRAHLARRLPESMLPSAVLRLDALPVNGSGKLDRAALPAPAAAVAAGRPPAPGTEARLAAVVAAVLGRDAVGAEEDFFDAGGDSLLAVDLAQRLRDGWGWDPGLGAVFEHPSVARLAAVLDAGPPPEAGDDGLRPLIRLRRAEATAEPAATGPLFALHPAGGLCWCYRGLARALAPGGEVFGLQSPGLAAEAPAPASLEALAEDYAARVLAVAPGDAVPHLLGWSVGGILAQAVAVRLRALGRRVGAVALLDSYPADAWREQPDPGPGAALRALLAVAGHDPTALPEFPPDRVPERDAVLRFLRDAGGPLGRLPAAALDGVARVVERNNRLVREHRHRRFDGPLLHFGAALDHAGTPLRASMWAPHAASVESVPLPLLHPQMVGAEASGLIAPLLRARMREAEAP